MGERESRTVTRRGASMGSYGSLFKLWRRLQALLGAIPALVVQLGAAPLAQAQTPNPVWEVFMRVSPCAGSLREFFTVASANPTGLGGGTAFHPARGPGNVFPRTDAGFVGAQAQADAKRILSLLASGESTGQEKYENYCCREHTVWRKGATLVTVRGMATPGPGFTYEAGPMCCEQAAIRAGTTAGCGTLQLSNGRSVALTANGIFPIGSGPIAVGPITINPTGNVTAAPASAPVAGVGPPVLGVPPSPPPPVHAGPHVSGVSPPPPPPAPVLGGAPPVLGVRPQQPPPVAARPPAPVAPSPPPAVASISRPPPPSPAAAYYVVGLDREIGIVVASEEALRTRPYCSWTGGGPQPCTGPANVVVTYGGPYASVDEARADMRARLACENGYRGPFVRHGNGRFWLQNNLGVSDCHSVKQH